MLEQELREAIVTSEQASGYWRMKCEKLRKSLAAAEGEAFAVCAWARTLTFGGSTQ